MADNLIFPIKFDLEGGVNEAIKDGDKALDRIATALEKNPITIKLRMDNKVPRGTSAELTGFKKQLAELTQQWNSLTAAERGGASGAAIREKFRALRQEAQGYTSTLQAAVKAEDKLRNAQNKTSVSTRNLGKEYQNTSSYLKNLLTKTAALWSLHEVSSFITGVRDVTAEFELQRVSLGAIIQDQQRANQLFSEIKSFALQSPLKILDLTKYTKQVAAYGIETEKLFDTTKRLADVSVGLGVDMGRLVLAYGQVKAASYLRAAEIRQFTEAGIPMLELLAKKFTDLQGKMVSTEQVMDLVSKRAVSFSMVEEIFNDMTSAGGMFYNMQEKQAQTLFGMWSKLGDAAAMMYDEIGNTEGVNAGMKMTIGLLESMMRNWETTARALSSVSVAMTVYIVGLKNAAIASKALTTAEAMKLAIMNKQIIATPKLIASIFGQNAATRLSTILTKAHTAAMIRQSAATNVLTKGLWKLTAAMLANPWIAAAAGVALVATALFHFIGNTETAAERAEKLNNSVASLKNLDDTTKPLIDTYNELINKTERTAEEQKKLSAVTHELAKQYPGAITAIGNFGEEVKLATDKLNQLYQAEKQARMENIRYELQKTEKQIASTEARIAQLQKYLSEGKMWGGGQSGAMVAMSNEEKKRVLSQIDELLYGEDGQSGLRGLKEAAQAARDKMEAMTKGITVEQLHIERFGAWKKKLTEFSKDVGNIKVRLFDDSTIDQFSTLEEALDAAAKKYKDAVESVEKYNKTLEKGVAGLGQEQFDKITAERDMAQATKELSEEALNYYNAMALLLKVMGGGRSNQSDPRLGILREIASTLKQVNKEYDELAKKEGAAKALADTQNKYANTFKYLQSLATKYKFELPNFGVPTDAASLSKYLDAIKAAMAKLPKSEKAVLSLETDIADINMADAQKKIEAQLKELANRVARTKTAKEFYDKMLNMTGDVELSANIAMSVFGDTGKDLARHTIAELEKAFGDVDISEAINKATGTIDYSILRKKLNLIDAQEQKEEAENLVDIGEKANAEWLLDTFKVYEKFKTFEEQRTEIVRRETEKRNQIINSNLPDAQKAMLFDASMKKQVEELNDIDWKEFKESDDWIRTFENIDNVATATIEHLIVKLRQFIDTNKDLTPEQLRIIMREYDKLYDQFIQRNPFKAIVEGIREYKAATRELAEARKEQQEAQKEMASAQAAYEEAYQAYLKGEGDIITTTNAYVNAAKRKKSAQETLAQADERLRQAEDKQKKSLSQTIAGFNAAASAVSNLQSILSQVVELFSVAEDSELGAFLQEVGKWLGIVAAGLSLVAAIIAVIEAELAPILAAAAGIAAIGALFTWLANSKVRRANKEIEKQQGIIDQLEYSYGRLEKAAEKAFGGDYIKNFKDRQANLQAQIEATQKQLAAEQSKGKKTDDDKVKEYQERIRDLRDQINDMQGELAEHFAGTDITSAARDFANAWIEAKTSFENTTDAMRGKFADMVQNMIVEAMAAKIMEASLSDFYKSIDEAAKDGDITSAEIANSVQVGLSSIDEMNQAMEVLWAQLKAAGVDTAKIWNNTQGDLTGISRDIASASEESINGLAAGINTQNYYMSFVPQIAEHVTAIRQFMERGVAAVTPVSVSAGWTDWQQQAMDNYNAIARNTAETVAECRRSAAACEAFAADIHRIIKVKGATQGINVFLNS